MLKQQNSDKQLSASDVWQPLQLDTSELQHRFGESVLLEFIRCHGPSAVLRELIQNEYDAGGSAMRVIFGKSELKVAGNGAPIDKNGWRRLSVTLGTGRVPGSNDELKLKENGIGSKNFGLRSLFLFGDKIYVRSNGKQTMLDIHQGALEKPIPDPTSTNIRGVRIHVPYRMESFGSLNAFTESFENSVLDDFATHISKSLLKLADYGKKYSLRSVIVSSARTGRQIEWKQSLRQRQNSVQGVNVFKRWIKMTDSNFGKSEILEEIEWQKRLKLPQEFRNQPMPGYFRERGAQIRVGISLPITHRGKLSPSRPQGIAFYPIGVVQARTGNCVSISAPFEMNSDRSDLLDPVTNEFNRWLLGCVAEITVDLLKRDWFDRFGAEAYRAVGDIDKSSLPIYANEVEEYLKENPCWPSRKVSRGKRPKILYKTARDLNLALSPSLDNFLADDQFLHRALCKSDELRNVAIRYCTKVFSLNSLIRLRCAGKSCDDLQLKLNDSEASYFYTNFPESWRNVTKQLRCADALDDNRKKLTKQNRDDLRTSETTLSASLSLVAANALWFVPTDIWDICPVPEDKRLHPELSDSKTLKSLTKPFRVANWISDVVTRIESGQADEHERSSLYKFILAKSGKVPRKVLAIVKKSPVLRDQEGNWVSPKSITAPATYEFRRFGPVLHLPHQDYIKDKDLKKNLCFKQKVTSDDVVQFAEMVSSEPLLEEKFLRALNSSTKLLTTRTIRRLASIRFICSSDGSLGAPTDLYLRTPKNEACIGPDGPYPFRDANRLFEKLGCHSSPSKEKILAYLADLRQKNLAPIRPDILYPELVRILKRESDSRNHKDEDILWTGVAYNAPANTLLGGRWDKVFLGNVPTINSSSAKMKRTYRELGVREKPEQHHWEQFFVSIGERFQMEPEPLSGVRRTAVLNAYRSCDELASPPSDIPWLLDDLGYLHSTADAKAGQLVIEDDVSLGCELRNLNAPVSFAMSEDPRIESFFRHCEVKLLTEARNKIKNRSGKLRSAPQWFREDEYLSRLKNPDFGSALKAMVGRDFSKITLVYMKQVTERLSTLRNIHFVEKIYVDYRVGQTKVSVSADYAWTDDNIHLTLVRSRADLESMLALLIAELCIPHADTHTRFSDSVFRLIHCESSSDIQKYLKKRGIKWHSRCSVSDDDAEDNIRDIEEVIRSAIHPKGSLSDLRKSRLSYETPNTESLVNEGSCEGTPLELPSLDTVDAQMVFPTGEWTYSPSTSAGFGGGGGGRFRGNRDEDRDRLIGERGEEIVYLLEKKKVQDLGYPEDRVVWVANLNPVSDFDIESIDENGEAVFIEVKSTTGTDGRFHWSLPEFQCALRERSRYFLYRVYRVNSCSPTVRVFQNPMSLMSNNELHLNIESFRAVVEPES